MKPSGALAAIALALGAVPAPAATDARIEEGRRVYNFRCYYCHGYSGDARTLASTMLTSVPRAFRGMRPDEMPRERIALAVRGGVPGTAMKSFEGTLTPREIDAVSAFVHDEFVLRGAANTRYHTTENGWPRHERYAAAYPFAEGRIALDTPEGSLSPGERAGRRLYLQSCITCHDRAKVVDEGPVWERAPAPAR